VNICGDIQMDVIQNLNLLPDSGSSPE